MAPNTSAAGMSLEQMRRWLARAYPDLNIPRWVTTVPGLSSRARGAAATANADENLITLYDPRLIQALNHLGRTRNYSPALRQPIQTGIHELMHLEGPRYGDNLNDRWLEEGLAESVAADVAPGFARSLKYRPQPARRFEDGSWSNPGDDFNFAPDTYLPNARAIRGWSFNQAAGQTPGWEGLEDPGASPEAMDFRRALLAMTNQQRNRTIAKTQKRMRREREAPDYLPKTVRSVGRITTAAAAIPRDPIAMAAQQVGRTVRAAGRSTPSAVRRRVNAHRSLF
jgi:hypothetical protein